MATRSGSKNHSPKHPGEELETKVSEAIESKKAF
jgi:hypothetical protein